MTLSGIACALVIGLAACSGGGSSAGVDESKPIAEIQAEAENMSADALRQSAEAYKKAIEDLGPEMEALAAKLKEIPPTQLLGEEAKAIKGDMEKLGGSVQSLTERFNVYLGELKKQNVDVSDLNL